MILIVLKFGCVKLDELGQSLVNLCNVVKNGVVCFFPSYAILENLKARWKTTGLLSRLERLKEVSETNRVRLFDTVAHLAITF